MRKCGNKQNMRHLHIRITLTCLTPAFNIVPSLQFYQNKLADFASQSHSTPRPIGLLPHVSVPYQKHAIICNISRYVDCNIRNDSAPGFLTFFSSTHFMYCRKFGKISTLHSVSGIFSTQLFPTLPRLSR